MDAEPLITQIAAALEQCGLEVILVGNAAAALQGAPVTTLDFDFMFRKSPSSLKKLKALARRLSGTIMTPYYPASNLYRLAMESGVQLDFMPTLHGVRSFESLRSRATRVNFAGHSLLVADLRDVIRSKKALGRPKDLAAIETLELTLHEKENFQKNRTERSEKGE